MKDTAKDFKLDLQFFAEGDENEQVDTSNEEVDGLADLSEEVQETINGLQEALNESTNKVTDLEKNLQEANDKLAVAEEFKTKFVEFIQSLGLIPEASVSEEAANDINKLKEDNAQLQVTVESLTNDNNGLLAQIAELKSKEVTSVAEQIVALKVTLGDITESDKDAEIEKLATRTAESLADTLADLQTRKPAQSRAIPQVTNPAQVENKQEGLLEGKDNKGEVEVVDKPAATLTAQQAFRGLLTGKKDILKNTQGGK